REEQGEINEAVIVDSRFAAALRNFPDRAGNTAILGGKSIFHAAHAVPPPDSQPALFLLKKQTVFSQNDKHVNAELYFRFL
ncbi:MAG: hypothetical protein BWK80_41895, partial [Desulfobacteraceae bacterium IS3]